MSVANCDWNGSVGSPCIVIHNTEKCSQKRFVVFKDPDQIPGLSGPGKFKDFPLGSVTTLYRIMQWEDQRHCVHIHRFNGSLSGFGTTQVSQYQKGKTNLDFAEARDSEWQWHQLGHMQVCTSLQTDNHANTPPFSFLQARCPSCRPTNSVKALKALTV